MDEGDAARLARYDRMYADLLAERDRAAAELERLRAAGKTKTVAYRERLADKLLVQNLLSRFAVYGLMEER